MGDGCFTADGVRSRIIPGTSSTQISSKSQFLEAAETAQNTGASSKRIRLFLPPLGTENKNKMVSFPIRDGSDFWASEIAENSRNKGSKKIP